MLEHIACSWERDNCICWQTSRQLKSAAFIMELIYQHSNKIGNYEYNSVTAIKRLSIRTRQLSFTHIRRCDDLIAWNRENIPKM